MIEGPTREVVESWVSEHRYRPFLVEANGDHECALDLYSWNATLSGALLEVLHHLEVLLRNAVDRELRQHEVPESARLTPSSGWWFASPTFVEREGLRVVEQTRERLRERLGPEHGDRREKVLSELTFGFWSGLFGAAYEDLFRRHLVDCFPDRPGSRFSRKSVVTALQDIRILRNRIAHHQPVIDHPVADVHERALELIGWISAEARAWVEQVSRVPDVLAARPRSAPATALVVPAAEAWPLYQASRAYLCEAGRTPRQVSHVAFSRDGVIERDVAAVEHRLDDVAFTSAEIGRLYRTHDPEQVRLARVIRDALAAGSAEARYGVLLLSGPGSPRHVTLAARVPHQGADGDVGVDVLRSAASADGL